MSVVGANDGLTALMKATGRSATGRVTKVCNGSRVTGPAARSREALVLLVRGCFVFC